MKKTEAMLPFGEALRIVLSVESRTRTETILFSDSAGRILAEDVISDIDMPPFNKSSMDGFACRKEDLGGELRVIETIPAGKWPEKRILQGQCSRIMTGAALPEGADCVIIVEEVEVLPDDHIRFRGRFTKDNIIPLGEDVRKGDVILRSGKIIRPQDIAVMASAGHTGVNVSVRPVVGVISTGSELVDPSEKPGISQIRNSNSSQLVAQAERAGAVTKYFGIARDDEEETLEMINTAISGSDIVVLTGGVSMGDFDFVPGVLETADVRILFSRVAVQPGKPTTFGVKGEKIIFGLPGNPVSSFIQFELLVKPLIYKMMGHAWNPPEIRLPLRDRFSRRSGERMAVIPVQIDNEGKVVPVEYHGSAHISALPDSDGVFQVAQGISSIDAGSLVRVILI